MMLQRQCLSFFPRYHLLQQPGDFKTFQLPLTQIHGVQNTSPFNKNSIKRSSQSSFNLTNQNKIAENEGKINNRNNLTQFNRYLVPLALKDENALTSQNDDIVSTSFLDVFRKKFDAIRHLSRPYSWINIIIAISSVSFLPIQSVADLTPTFFKGILKAIGPTILMNIYLVSLNQICDVEIDKINKPYLPLASGELSMGVAITIAIASAFMGLALGVMSGSPIILWSQILAFLFSSAYSLPLPFLRWKGHTFLAPFTIVILMGLGLQIPNFIHIQRYVLGRQFVITRPFIFATTIMSVLAFANGLLKDLPDENGDSVYGMQTLCVLLGKKRVFSLCVNMILMTYGGAMIAGASSSFMLSKIVTIIGHSILASILWLRSQNVDLDSFESTFNFYSFIWKLNYVEYFLIHFSR